MFGSCDNLEDTNCTSVRDEYLAYFDHNDFSGFCLAFVITDVDFHNGTAGLAHIGGACLETQVGVCLCYAAFASVYAIFASAYAVHAFRYAFFVSAYAFFASGYAFLRRDAGVTRGVDAIFCLL